MKLETVKIRLKKEGIEMVINAYDFNAELHEKVEDKKPVKEKAKAEPKVDVEAEEKAKAEAEAKKLAELMV